MLDILNNKRSYATKKENKAANLSDTMELCEMKKETMRETGARALPRLAQIVNNQ